MKNKVAHTIILVAIAITLVLICVISIRLKTLSTGSEEVTIRNFEKNYQEFMEVVEYAEQSEGYFYAHYIADRDIIVGDDYKTQVTINDPNVRNQLEHIIKKLKYRGVSESNGIVRFIKSAGQAEAGIVYISDNKEPDYFNYYKLIRENWYYYIILNV